MENISCKKISLSVPGKTLLINTDLNINEGSKYALIGYNGVGKTTLLRNIFKKSWKIPKNADIFYVEQEVVADPNKTVFQMVIDANVERRSLLNRYNVLQKLVEVDDVSDKNFEEYTQVVDQLKVIGADKDESIVRYVLHGLGFEGEDQNRPTSEFSGGWRMRISLARALYLKPQLLLLDEPTNHLDLNAAIWLTTYLSSEWKNTLIVISHDKNFINDVCTNVIHLYKQKLFYYKGNYDKYLKTKAINDRQLEKEWKKVQRRVIEMKNKSVSKKKVNEFLSNYNHLKPTKPYKMNMDFGKVTQLKSPVIEITNITFGYDAHDHLFEQINKIIDLGTRVAIVGKNGIGKTTFIKCILSAYNKENQFTLANGNINIDRRAKIGYYNQHAADILPLDETPIDYLLSIDSSLGYQDARKFLGSIGLEGNLHKSKIRTLSGGQKSRVVFAGLFVLNPHIIFLDEPTNHLDIETTTALIDGINEFNGGVIMVTHDIELIQETDAKLWELENKKINETFYEEYEDKVLNEMTELYDKMTI
jgi:ATP-binding cassette subfamily F protein 1